MRSRVEARAEPTGAPRPLEKQTETVSAPALNRSRGTSSAHAAFFYILSALHALHLAGGLIALLVAVRRPRIRSFAATYWHCMGPFGSTCWAS